MTTEFARRVGRDRQAGLEHGRCSEEKAPAGLQHDHLIGREVRRWVHLDDVPTGIDLPPPYDDLVRLAHDVKDHRQPDPDEHRELQRDEHCEHEGREEDGLLHGARVPDGLKICGLDGSVSDENQQAGQRWHRNVAHNAGEGDDHDCHHHSSEHE